MKTRLITSIFIMAFYALVLSLTIFANKFFYDIFVLLLMVIAGFEVSKAIGKKFARPIDFFVFLNTIVGYITFYILNNVLNKSSGIAAYFAVLAIMALICVIYCMFSKTITMKNVTSTILVMVYPVTILVYMLGLNYVSQDPNSNIHIAAILLMFAISSFTDTFAYLVGSTLKGPKLCPSVSPKKTISGAVGGLLGGIIGAGLVLLCSVYGWLKVPMLTSNVTANIIHFMVIGLVGSVFNQMGDLVASYVKRQCDVKDYGKFLPGHGGVMDRIDGFMLTAIFLYIYISILVF